MVYLGIRRREGINKQTFKWSDSERLDHIGLRCV